MGSLAWYRQDRTQLSQGAGVTTVLGTRAKGGELEVRYVLDQNFSFTFAGSLQHTIVKGPDHEFEYVPARDAGVSPLNGFGGSYVTFDFASLPGKAGNYEDTLVPHAVLSPYFTYSAGQLGRDLRGHLCFADPADGARSFDLPVLCHHERVSLCAAWLVGRDPECR